MHCPAASTYLEGTLEPHQVDQVAAHAVQKLLNAESNAVVLQEALATVRIRVQQEALGAGVRHLKLCLAAVGAAAESDVAAELLELVSVALSGAEQSGPGPLGGAAAARG